MPKLWEMIIKIKNFFISPFLKLTITHKLARVIQHIQFLLVFLYTNKQPGDKNMAGARAIFSFF